MNAANLLRWYRLVFAGLIVAASALTLARPEHHALGVFAVAELASIGQGQLPTHLLQYAAAVVFVIALDRCLSRSRGP